MRASPAQRRPNAIVPPLIGLVCLILLANWLCENDLVDNTPAKNEHEADFKKNFDSFHSHLGPYEEFAPVYEWGYRMAKDPRYRDETFEKAEPDLKRVFTLANPPADWDKISELVLYGWEQAGGTIENRFTII